MSRAGAINASNAPLALQQVYRSLGWAGTAVMCVEEGSRYAINCQTFSIGQCCIMEDADGVVDSIYRLEKFTARQCVQKWGDKEWLQFGIEGRNWMLSQFLHGEQGALICTAKIVETVPWYDAKMYASTQVMDEARHVEVFARYLKEKLGGEYQVNVHLRTLLDDIVAGNRILAGLGVLDGFGHVSARHPLHADRYLLSRSLAPELVTRDDIMTYDLASAAQDHRVSGLDA